MGRRSPAQALRQQIAFFEGRARAQPDQWVHRVRLARLYQQLATLRRELAPHRQALRHAAAATRAGGPRWRNDLVRARSLLALHRFAPARAALDAAPPAARNRELEALRAEHALALEDFARARTALGRLQAMPGGEVTAHAMLALLEDALDHRQQALAHFDSALELAKTRAPDRRGWIFVLRGHSRMQRGALEQARADFRAALDEAPHSVLAREHLAQVELMLGHPQRAIGLYQAVIAQSDSPEYQHALAEAYRAAGNPQAAARAVVAARAGYERWLKDYPEAAYSHAAAFFSGPGASPRRAVALLRKNAELRPTGSAYRDLAAALLAANEPGLALAAITRALAAPARNAKLFWVASRVLAAAGHARRAAEHERRALSINPRRRRM